MSTIATCLRRLGAIAIAANVNAATAAPCPLGNEPRSKRRRVSPPAGSTRWKSDSSASSDASVPIHPSAIRSVAPRLRCERAHRSRATLAAPIVNQLIGYASAWPARHPSPTRSAHPRSRACAVRHDPCGRARSLGSRSSARSRGRCVVGGDPREHRPFTRSAQLRDNGAARLGGDAAASGVRVRHRILDADRARREREVPAGSRRNTTRPRITRQPHSG